MSGCWIPLHCDIYARVEKRVTLTTVAFNVKLSLDNWNYKITFDLITLTLTLMIAKLEPELTLTLKIGDLKVVFLCTAIYMHGLRLKQNYQWRMLMR